jgi:hypothetical protein
MSDESDAEDQWVAMQDQGRKLAYGLEAFLDWWDANPNDHEWFRIEHPDQWHRLMAVQMMMAPRRADRFDDEIKAYLQAMANRIARYLGEDDTDAYLLDDTLYRLDTLTGHVPVRGQIVDFP